MLTLLRAASELPRRIFAGPGRSIRNHPLSPMLEYPSQIRGDPDRLRALRSLDLLDAPAEEAFDRLTRIARRLLEVPAAFISLVDEERDFYLSHCGFGEPLASTRQLAGETFCHYAMVSQGPLVIEDTRAHPAYRNVPTVESLGVAAYVGVPLRLPSGAVLGSFCVIDTSPRRWTEGEVSVLEELAATTLTEIQLRRSVAEAALARIAAELAEARYSDLVHGLDAVVWEMDARTWTFTFVSEHAEEMLGYPIERWLTESGFWQDQLLHPEDREGALRFCTDAAQAGRDHEFEYRAVAADGRVVWLHDRVRLVPSEDGRPALLRGVMVDITERKRITEALAESEQRFRQLAESIDAVFWLYDFAREQTVYVSPAYACIWGRSREELYEDPRAWAGAIHPDDRERVVTEMNARREVEYEFEYRIVRPDGEVRWIRDRGFPIRNVGGEVYRTAGLAEDITEERRAAASLQESEEKFRQLAENVHELFWIFSADFTEAIYLSPAYEALWGRPLESVYRNPTSFLDAVHPEDLGALTSALQTVRECAFDGVEYRVTRPDGTTRWMFSRGFPVPDERGEVTRVVGTTADITERKRAEEELAAAEAHYRRLVETAPQAIYALDAGGRFNELNPAAERLLERAAEELMGQHFSTVIAPRDLDVAQGGFDRVISGEQYSIEFEERIQRPSGEERLLRVTQTAMLENGVITGTHGIAWDITEERARQEQMRLLATALASLDEGVSIAHFDGRLVYANAAHARLLGYDLDAGSMPNVQDFISNDGANEQLREAVRIAAKQGTWTGRVRWRRRDDGSEIPLEIILGRVDREEGESLLFIISRDISEVIQKEQQLRRAERLASAGTLVSGVAHELNNPLHAIRNFAELMLLDPRSEDDRESLEIVKREADRAAKVVSDLRRIARQTQEGEERREAVDLNDVLRHVLKVRRYSLETGNVEVRKDLAEDLPRVLGARSEIEQVVLNLVVNAEQAMAGGDGKRRLLLRTRGTSDGAALHVVDSGPGIPRPHLERIFDPFFTTKSPGVGTGLGLSLAHNIITEHGGEIHVDSEVGKGTAFRIDLPRAPGARAPAPQRHAPTPSAVPMRILVVDDEEAVRRVSVRFLMLLGHHADTAADGGEALRLLEAADYDLILSDLRMPGLDGEQLLQHLRKREGGLEHRLIFITGDVASEHAAGLVAAANVPVLIKPVRLEDLARAVEHAAQRRGHASDPPDGGA